MGHFNLLQLTPNLNLNRMPPKPQPEPPKEERKGPPPKPKVYVTEAELLEAVDFNMLTVIEKLQP